SNTMPTFSRRSMPMRLAAGIPATEFNDGRIPGRDAAPSEPSADGLANELGDLLLDGRRPIADREADRPQVAVVEGGPVLEADRRIARLELAGRLDEHDALAFC